MLNEIQISVLEMKSGSTSLAKKIQTYFFKGNYIEINKCQEN